MLMETQIYAAKHISFDVKKRSSSGGAFTALSDTVLSAGGCIIAARYDYQEKKLKHMIAKTVEERDAMRGSKYMVSDLGNIFKESLSMISIGTPVLFVGTPCQVLSYRCFLEKNQYNLDNVCLVDLVCHGTPMKQFWNSYIIYFEKKYGCSIDYLTFKDKRNGWRKPVAVAECGGREISI